MSIDLSQFHQVFFEESFEGLDIMESSLMELDPDDIDSETINTIFRSAHSIKGGSATFGFRSIAEFTHVLETLLDEARSGQRNLSTDDINLFLQSVDCMREMLGLLQNGDDGATELSVELEAKFKALLASAELGEDKETSIESEAQAPESNEVEEDAPLSQPQKGWKIEFLPHGDILKCGNDPFRIIRELAELGGIHTVAHYRSIPALDSLDPEMCYLSWDITLDTECEKREVEEIFEWVVDDSDIFINPISADDNTFAAADTLSEKDANIVWKIDFTPHEDILLTGNDPLKLFSILEEMGEYHVEADISSVPQFTALNELNCYISWQITLESTVADRETILEVFEWVLDDADVNISAVSGIFAGFASSETLSQEAKASNTTLSLVTVNEANKNNALRVETPSSNFNKADAFAGDPAGIKANSAVSSKVEKGTKPVAKKPVTSTESSSIRVGIDKVDNLINMVGELVITQSMLGQLGTDFELDRVPKLLEGLSQLEQNTRELQESVMRIRMLPISFAFSRFPRMVRDLSQSLGKKVDLVMLGEQTELDKTVMEKIGDPLVHLVRNAVDHGIETPDIRESKGKQAFGEIVLNAYHQGGNVVIEIIDDGKGLNAEALKEKAVEKGVITSQEAEVLSKEQAFDLIFHPGFSTAKEVSDVSGRGVGMDVVRRNIQALNGVVELTSEIDKGSTIKIRLPLTLAILDGQLVRVGDCTYVIPLTSIVESLQANRDMINRLAGGCNVLRLRDDYVPIIQLADTFNHRSDALSLEESLLVVLESDNGKVAVVVDELLAQQQVVIKSLEQNYRRVDGVSGATILGDGTVALILDIPGIVRLAEKENQTDSNTAFSMFKHLNEETSHSQRA